MQSSSPEQQTGQDSRSARRRLIRGAFGAPAALTLYSGSALAAASHCVARQLERGDPKPGLTTSPTQDIYLRVQVRAKGNAGNASTWVSGADLLLAATTPAVVAAPASSFLGTDNWHCLTAGNGAGYNAGQIYDNATAISNRGTPQPNGTYVAIRVRADGYIAGVTDTADATAVSGSCWASFVKIR